MKERETKSLSTKATSCFVSHGREEDAAAAAAAVEEEEEEEEEEEGKRATKLLTKCERAVFSFKDNAGGKVYMTDART